MAELRNIKWGKFLKTLSKREYLDALRKSHSLQWWLTLGLRDNGFMVLDDLEDLVLEYKGVKFLPDVYNYARIFEAWDRYRIENIRPTDVVLDLGANIGSFTLPAAQRAQGVVAVEPLFHGYLYRNLKLNNLFNVDVIPFSLGAEMVDAGLTEVTRVRQIYLGEVLEYVGGGIDVLRIDIGGAEWSLLEPWYQQFLGVRQFEIEFHFYKGEKGRWEDWKRFFESEGYGYTARWSKHKHWLYVSAERGGVGEELQLKDGSFRGQSLVKWRS